MKSKRSLGQNFFINKNLCEQIVDIVTKEQPDLIVEIGPGKGSFTQSLSEKNQNLLLIEKDNNLAEDLIKSFPNSKVRNVDFLEYNMDDLDTYGTKNILFFGSLPYNASKPIIRKIITSKYFNSTCYFIIQKEVADKYTAKEPNNNLLSIETHLYSDVKKLFDISPESFKPKPKVTSSFVCFSPKKKIPDIDMVTFRKFLYMCFKQPRKTIKNNLRDIDTQNRGQIAELLSMRPQHLSLDEYLFLFTNVKDLLI
jgi:16S rRNA (adenine1518-N6/adenine1519-N6)-dimethyltransferase